MLKIIGLIAIGVVFFLGSIGVGEQWINPFSPVSALDAMILWDIRFPRVLLAFAVGGLLALAGAWFQVLLGNPLAEPYVLGVAGSSAVGAIVAMMFWPDVAWVMSMGAWVGAWVGIVLVLRFAYLGANRLLLAGVVLAAFWGAMIALLLSIMPERGVASALAWMMGDLSSSWISPDYVMIAWVVALACGLYLSHALDALLLGSAHAQALGVDLPVLQQRLLLLASMVTAVAVTAAGTVGFIGLVVPHLMRLMFGAMHRTMLIASAVGGGVLLMVADTVARTLVAPAEIPVGVITALMGVPLFLFLLLRRDADASH
ncbi:MAG: iron chelate uptake ABC transporter family permease subunit [Zetaproteobacteria bacterium]|nr:iron chelate uptake ABC transporter family permease subunit [Zetaproteobacteria bacterium]